MAEYTCIVCPNSCRITVEETENGLDIRGNQCNRGAEFARKEHTEPMRMFTSTVKLEGSIMRRLAVVTTGEVHKENIGKCQDVVKGLTVTAPIRCGDVIVADFCNEGIDLVAAKTINE